MNKLFFLSALVGLILFGCKPPISFSEPQPVGKRNLSRIPKSFQGHYYSEADSMEIWVEDTIVKTKGPQKIESNFQVDVSDKAIPSDSTVLAEFDEVVSKVNSHPEKDVVLFDNALLKLDENTVLRKFKGRLFLNTDMLEHGWEVKMIEKKRGYLYVRGLEKEEAPNLKRISHKHQLPDSPYKFEMTRKEFKKLIKSGAFTEKQVFKKID